MTEVLILLIFCVIRAPVFKIHYLMGVLVVIKSLSLIFHAVNYHFIQIKVREGLLEMAPSSKIFLNTEGFYLSLIKSLSSSTQSTISLSRSRLGKALLERAPASKILINTEGFTSSVYF